MRVVMTLEVGLRMSIFIAEEPRTVSEIARYLNLNVVTVRRHVRLSRERGLLYIFDWQLNPHSQRYEAVYKLCLGGDLCISRERPKSKLRVLRRAIARIMKKRGRRSRRR